MIPPNGKKKRFIEGGVVKGGCFPIPGDDQATICICEGYATGATIREATRLKVLVAFSAGNLENIAREAIKKFPDREILICADNDHVTAANKGINPGIDVAKKIKDKYGLNYVYPVGITGTDFNDMAAEIGLDAVKQAILSRYTIECMEPADCYTINDSLEIPSGINLPGLIGQGLEALEGDILQYSLPLVLTVISRAIAGKISLNRVHPNVFNIKVGSTSTGKTSTDKKFLGCLDIPNFISMHDAASGPGIWRAVSDNPQGMGFFDEVSSLFIRHVRGGVDMIAEGKINTLLDLYSRSGEDFTKVFGDSKNKIHIQNPCVSIIGNATPTIFEAIQLKDFETGLMQRFDFWVYDGEIKEKSLLIGSNYYKKTKDFISKLHLIMDAKPDIYGAPESLASLIKGCVDLSATDEAIERIKVFSKGITKDANNTDSEGERGFISRRFDLGLKYALIHHAAVKGDKKLYDKVDLESVDWGIKVAEMISGWKLSKLSSKVVSGDFHRDCEAFKEAVKSSIKANRNATFSYMASRRPLLKDWDIKYSEKIITVLTKRGEIIKKEGKNGATLYLLPKKWEPKQ